MIHTENGLILIPNHDSSVYHAVGGGLRPELLRQEATNLMITRTRDSKWVAIYFNNRADAWIVLLED